MRSNPFQITNSAVSLSRYHILQSSDDWVIIQFDHNQDGEVEKGEFFFVIDRIYGLDPSRAMKWIKWLKSLTPIVQVMVDETNDMKEKINDDLAEMSEQFGAAKVRQTAAFAQ